MTPRSVVSPVGPAGEAALAFKKIEPLHFSRASVFDALMLNDANLLRHDIEVLTDLGAYLDERMSVGCSDVFRFRSFVTQNLAREPNPRGQRENVRTLNPITLRREPTFGHLPLPAPQILPACALGGRSSARLRGRLPVRPP